MFSWTKPNPVDPASIWPEPDLNKRSEPDFRFNPTYYSTSLSLFNPHITLLACRCSTPHITLLACSCSTPHITLLACRYSTPHIT